MQSLTEAVMKLAPPGGRNLFPSASEGARKQQVHRAARSGETVRLKPGLFLLGRDYRRTELHPYVVAALLHSPSQVSIVFVTA